MSDDLYAYLPKELRNPFIEAGHNTYKKALKREQMGKGGAVSKARIFKHEAVKAAKAAGGDVKAVKKAASQGVRKTVFNQKVALGKPGFKKYQAKPPMTTESGGGMATPSGKPNPGTPISSGPAPTESKGPKPSSSGQKRTPGQGWNN